MNNKINNILIYIYNNFWFIILPHNMVPRLTTNKNPLINNNNNNNNSNSKNNKNTNKLNSN